jgi:hypothetical protein
VWTTWKDAQPAFGQAELPAGARHPVGDELLAIGGMAGLRHLAAQRPLLASTSVTSTAWSTSSGCASTHRTRSACSA